MSVVAGKKKTKKNEGVLFRSQEYIGGKLENTKN